MEKLRNRVAVMSGAAGNLGGSLDTPKNRENNPAPGPSTSNWVSLDSVIDVILFLLSRQARSVHAAAINVDGPESSPGWIEGGNR